jgi:uncharacterized membrane protein
MKRCYKAYNNKIVVRPNYFQFKRFFIIIFLLIFYIDLPIIFAEENIFGNESSELVPPSLPGMESPELNIVTLFLRDIQGNNLSDVHAKISVIDKQNNSLSQTLQYLRSNKLFLKLTNGSYDIGVGLDDMRTSGFDYYANKNILVESSSNSYFELFPVGSLRGIVRYEDGTVVENADIKYECVAKYAESEQIISDKYGVFIQDIIPVGNCVVYAKKNQMIATKEVTIKQGEIVNVDLTLKKNNSGFLMVIIIGTGVLILLVVFIFHLYRRAKKLNNMLSKNDEEIKILEEKKIVLEAKTNSIPVSRISKRSEDIIKTLNEKERLVVEYLMKEDNVYQNKVVYATGIAKTSIVRLIDSLERKKIIRTEKFGKTKKLKLTDWFLEK